MTAESDRLERMTKATDGAWFAPNAPLRSVSRGGVVGDHDVLLIYQSASDGTFVVATSFRKTRWADKDALAPYEPGLERNGVDISIRQMSEDVLTVDGTPMLRTRFLVGSRAATGSVDLQDSSRQPARLRDQLDQLSRTHDVDRS